MQSSGNHKIKATSEQINTMLAYYQGYLTYNASDYIIARAKLPHATITFYKTNVVLFQGVNEIVEYNIWAKQFGLAIDQSKKAIQKDLSSLSAIGSDEVGTGDYFGPIVVCAAYVSSSMIEQLRLLGVKDSKLLTDKQMIPMALKLSQMIPYSIVYLDPERINLLSKKRNNLNFVKAYLHNKAINSILKKTTGVKCDAILIDEFTPQEKYFEYLSQEKDVIKNVTLIPNGEKAHMSVAAASILARVTFLRELSKLSKTYDFEFYKGAGPEVDKNAISFVKANGWDELRKIAKMKFSNTERIRQYFLNNPMPKSRQGSFYNEK
ncbi:MAG: ribonuclease HIII [Prevotella sp.]|nr:ribonuclease HIII [Staphylococcus sp.]MCM1349760.1 ribonuclease HIII [Prevotella sp.]